MKPAALRASGIALVGAALTLSCGSRTGLLVEPVCATPGEVMECTDGCAVGQRTCGKDGLWSACAAPLVTEPCSNDCGMGLRTCSGGTFGECVVPPVTLSCASKCGTGEQSCVDGTLGVCSAPQPLPPVLEATVRDFLESHPDMEREEGRSELGLVAFELGPDDKPVYLADEGGTVTTTGPAFFDQWYRDVPGVNLTTKIELPLMRSPRDERLYLFQSRAFFPIDDELFGNEGNIHNFHFTLEATGTFLYQGGETFRFTGDDDVFVFVNRQLVIDLGGLHQSLSQVISLDGVASKIGLELGGLYPLHIFFAERKTFASNFNIETSIEGLGDCPG